MVVVMIGVVLAVVVLAVVMKVSRIKNYFVNYE